MKEIKGSYHNVLNHLETADVRDFQFVVYDLKVQHVALFACSSYLFMRSESEATNTLNDLDREIPCTSPFSSNLVRDSQGKYWTKLDRKGL